MKRWSVHCCFNWGATTICHDKTTQRVTKWYLFEFLKNDTIWKLRPCFIPKVTCSVLSCLSACCQFSLCYLMYIAWEHDVWLQSGMDVGQSNHNKGRGSLRRVNCNYFSQLKRKTVTLYLTIATIFQNNIFIHISCDCFSKLWLYIPKLQLFKNTYT